MLGANDWTISVASLVVGVAAAGATQADILLTGVAGLIAGGMSMAAGEYISVKSQADTERADIEREKSELELEPERELAELTSIYIGRGLDRPLARQVAEKMMAYDALGAHSRDELGITERFRAQPFQAAAASAVSFVAGAIVPIATALLAPAAWLVELSAAMAINTLVIFGGVAAHAGGAPIARGALRVGFWGAAAMGITAVVGKLFGSAV